MVESEVMVQAAGLAQSPFRLIHTPLSANGASRMVRVLDEEGVEVAPPPDLGDEDLISLYEWMVRLRVFDTRMLSLQRQGRLGFFVPSSGEEAAQIGTAYALRPEDWVFPAYREQGVALHRGFPLEGILCQLLGNSHDYMKGRQMPDHFGSPKYRFAVASSPVGTQIPHAVGAAWSARLRREASVATVYFGDGATSTGDFHAGMNFAAVQQLPVVFYCKNNGWAISLPCAKQYRCESLADRAIGYGMPGVRVDGNDVLAVYSAAQEALEWARSGSGPVFVEMVTQRMGPHSTADDPTRYRAAELLEPWKKKDPITRFRRYLESMGIWSAAEEERAHAEMDARITEALEWAEQLPPPDTSSMFEDVYAEVPWHLDEQRRELQGGE